MLKTAHENPQLCAVEFLNISFEVAIVLFRVLDRKMEMKLETKGNANLSSRHKVTARADA